MFYEIAQAKNLRVGDILFIDNPYDYAGLVAAAVIHYAGAIATALEAVGL